jgi:hypothetical protein
METNTQYSAQRWEAEKLAYSQMMGHWLTLFRLLKTAQPSLSSMGPQHRNLMRKMAGASAENPEEEYYLLETFNLL